MDRFKIISSLGAGASGEALLATEKSTGTEYVIKKIDLVGVDQETRQRAAREAKILQMLNHPNIIRFHSSFFDESSNTFCIVMERCVCSLEDLVDKCLQIPDSKGGFPQSLLIEWMTELLAALTYLQSKNVIHRDLKASNIFVTKKNHLKIGDFGVCKHEHNTSESKKSNDTSSLSSTFVGTAFYMPPEIFDDQPADHKGDVWSLGILFYELCTLRHPFSGGNILAIVNEITTKSYDPLPSYFDARFSRIIRWMLKKDPSQRPTASGVLNKYVFLPPSHPSHPQHDADSGRSIQERHGPQLVLCAGGKDNNKSNSNNNNNNNNKQSKENVVPKNAVANSNSNKKVSSATRSSKAVATSSTSSSSATKQQHHHHQKNHKKLGDGDFFESHETEESGEDYYSYDDEFSSSSSASSSNNTNNKKKIHSNSNNINNNHNNNNNNNVPVAILSEEEEDASSNEVTPTASSQNNNQIIENKNQVVLAVLEDLQPISIVEEEEEKKPAALMSSTDSSSHHHHHHHPVPPVHVDDENEDSKSTTTIFSEQVEKLFSEKFQNKSLSNEELDQVSKLVDEYRLKLTGNVPKTVSAKF